MSRYATKSAGNVYHDARIAQSAFNPMLTSRCGASELLDVSQSVLDRIELEKTKSVPMDLVISMSKLYNAPELKNHYCVVECPMHRGDVLSIEHATLSESSLQVICSIMPDECKRITKDLLRICKDGQITADEVDRCYEVIDFLDGISRASSVLKNTFERIVRANGWGNKASRTA